MKNFSAFTLSEVLITLGVLGVVAALTMPTLIQNVTERANSERQANIALKVTQGMERMRSLGKLNESYDSTESFVDELQKYLKIAKRCDKDHLADCWPTEKVTAGDGQQYDVSDFKTGRSIGLVSSITDNVGIVLADGGAFILNYNPSSGTIDVGDPVTAQKKSLSVGGGKSKDFAYTSSVTSAIDFVMDVNGAKGPNTENIGNKWGDIRSFKAANFSGCPGFRIPDVGCVTNLDSYAPVKTDDFNNAVACFCFDMEDCNCPEQPKINNYYQGAVAACESYGMHLTTGSEIMAIQNQYGKIEGVPESGRYWVESFMSSWISSVNGRYVHGHSTHTFSAPRDPNEPISIATMNGGGPSDRAQDSFPAGVLCVKNE